MRFIPAVSRVRIPLSLFKYRGVAQVVERHVRDVEAASSSLVTPIEEIKGFGNCRNLFSFNCSQKYFPQIIKIV